MPKNVGCVREHKGHCVQVTPHLCVEQVAGLVARQHVGHLGHDGCNHLDGRLRQLGVRPKQVGQALAALA